MISMNETYLLGRLGAAVKKYSHADNRPHCSFSLAINERKADGDSCDWFECEAWGNMATIIDRLNLYVGQDILVKGKLRNRKNMAGVTEKVVVLVLDLKVFAPKQKFATGENKNG